MFVGNRLTDINKQFHLPLGFASGINDKNTGLVHFGFREYDPEVGRFTAQDPLGYGGGDVDVYGYCLDDPINFNDAMGLEAGGIWGTTPRRHNVKKWYIWKAGKGACDKCLKMDGNISETPTMKRPHPNCKCQQDECQTWDEHTKWEETKRLGNGPATMSQPVFPPGATTVSVTWRRKIRVEEGRTSKHFKMQEGTIKLLYSKYETRVVTKTEVRGGSAHRINSNYGVENGDSWWATNPWTGQTIGGGYDS